MAYDLEEQEELDVLKDWWKRNGNTVIWAIAVIAVSFAGFRGWQYYQRTQTSEASVHYDALAQLGVNDIKSIRSLSGQLMDSYSTTTYAARAALLAAKANYEAKDVKSAKAQLQWAIDHSKEDQVRGTAQLQLAAILLEEKQHDAALKVLAAKHDPAFDGLFADLKGDILRDQGKLDEAKIAYKDALTKLDEHARYRRYTEHKLDALGS